MSEPIEAGLLGSIGNFIKKLSKSISTGLDKLSKYGYEVSDSKQSDDGGLILTVTTGGGNVFKMKCVPVEGQKDVFNYYFKAKGKPNFVLEEISGKDFVKVMQKAAMKFFDEDSIEDAIDKEGNDHMNEPETTAASKKLKVTLKRVTCGKTDSINLVAVYANYSPVKAMKDLQAVLSDDEFTDEISEEPTSYEVSEVDDGYDVEPADEVVTDGSFTELLKAAYNAYLCMQNIHWNVWGDKFMRIHEMSDNYLWRIRDVIDTIAEMGLEGGETTPHPIDLIKSLEDVGSGVVDADTANEAMAQVLMDLCTSLELYYPNMTHDIQSVFDNWIREFKSQAEFKLRRM